VGICITGTWIAELLMMMKNITDNHDYGDEQDNKNIV
jgi:hypothetical protein